MQGPDTVPETATELVSGVVSGKKPAFADCKKTVTSWLCTGLQEGW